MKRWYDAEWGWGTVKIETEHFVVVIFDADPWTYRQIAKEEE